MGARRSPAPRLRGPRLKLTRVLVLVIRFDDVLNQFMTHDVALVKVHKTDTVDVAKDVPHFDQPRDAVGGSIRCEQEGLHSGGCAWVFLRNAAADRSRRRGQWVRLLLQRETSSVAFLFGLKDERGT